MVATMKVVRQRWTDIKARPKLFRASWDWAVLIQEQIWFANDAYWVDQAQSGWPDKDEFKGFLAAYSLGRSMTNRDAFRALVRSELNDKTLPKPGDQTFVDDVVRIWEKLALDKAPGDKNLWSAGLKAMWFRWPDKLPMFDSYVNLALPLFATDLDGEKRKRSVYDDDKRQFLQDYEMFFDKIGRREARAAKKRTGLGYPYERRIAEKWLWLMASDKKTHDRIKFALEQVIEPLQRGQGEL